MGRHWDKMNTDYDTLKACLMERFEAIYKRCGGEKAEGFWEWWETVEGSTDVEVRVNYSYLLGVADACGLTVMELLQEFEVG